MTTWADSFNRADASGSATSLGNTDTGNAPWVTSGESGGTVTTWGIASNQCDGGDSHSTANVDTGTPDIEMEFTMPVVNDSGVAIRTNVSNGSGYVANAGALYWHPSSGGFSSMGNFSAGFGNTDVAKVVTSGNNIEVFRNGSSVLSFSSTDNNTATCHGMRSHNTVSRFDGFSIIFTGSAAFVAARPIIVKQAVRRASTH